MMPIPRSAVSTAALMLLLYWAAAPSARACGFHGFLDGSFSAMHARSLDVAFAVRDAVESEILPGSVLEPIVPGGASYWRAVGRLNNLTSLLSKALPDGPAPSITVLLIDSSLWSRLSANPSGYWLEAHTNREQAGDVVVVTTETVVAEILREQISIEIALARNLIVIDGDVTSANHVRHLLVEALDRSHLPALRTVPHQPVRFFGPRR